MPIGVLRRLRGIDCPARQQVGYGAVVTGQLAQIAVEQVGSAVSDPGDLFGVLLLRRHLKPLEVDAVTEGSWGAWAIEIKTGSQETSIDDVYTGGDANRGGSTAIRAAGDGQAAAREIAGTIPFSADEIRSLGRDSLFVRCDVTKKDDVQEMVRRTVEQFGRLDVADTR